jgi:Flp pilus assembly pilin Flp
MRYLVRVAREFAKDESGVLPIEYLHVFILATAVLVTTVQFVFN